MSLLRWFFTDKCPNCKGRIAAAAKFCSTCGWGNEKTWRNCTSCGRSVGADSNFCWGCQANLRQQPQTQIVSDCWRREPGVAAIRVTIETPEARLRNGIQVDEDTRGVFLRNGVIARDSAGPVEIGTGYHPLTSFMQRLFGSKPSETIEALIATIAPVEVRMDAGPAANLLTSDYLPLEASVLVKLQIQDLGKFQNTFVPRGKELVRDDELAQPVLARVTEILRRLAARRTGDGLLTDPDVRRAIEADLGAELPFLLAETGLKFHSVTDVRFTGDALERKRQHLTGRASAQMEAAAMELQQSLDLASRTHQIKTEDELQSTIDRIAHDRCLNRTEREHLITMRREFMERERLIAHTHTHGQVQGIALDYELERKRKLIQLEKEEDASDLDTLGRLRQMQMETLASMKRIKAEDERARLRNLAEHAAALDKVSDSAKIAVISAEQGRNIVELVRAQQPLAQPQYMAQSDNAAALAQHGLAGQNLEDIVPRYIPAVGLILKQNAKGEIERVGTAWIAQGRGVLVTNAHVADEVDPKRGGGWVVFPGTNGEPYRIASVELHPEYVRQLTVDPSGQLVSANTNAAVLTHDVAIVRLANSAPHVGVPIAARHKLNALRDLQPVAYVGYPMRGMAGAGTSAERPRPVSKRGTISSLTDWQQREVHTSAEAHLIKHDMGVTGGASGSPLWDAQGEVVGIICGMNVERVYNATLRKFEVIPSAALVNFAQRIDVLTEWLGW